MDLNRLSRALGLVTALSAMTFAAGMALVFALTGPYLAMMAHIYAGETEPVVVSLPFPTWLLLGLLGLAAAAGYKGRADGRWGLASVGLSMVAFCVEVSWLVDVYVASAPL